MTVDLRNTDETLLCEAEAQMLQFVTSWPGKRMYKLTRGFWLVLRRSVSMPHWLAP